MNQTATQLKEDLEKFTGSSKFFQHELLNQKIFITEGVHYLCEKAGAYWLCDIVLSYFWKPELSQEEFQVWTLQRMKGDAFQVTCSDGEETMLTKQDIPYSDFPLDKITLWLVNNEILMLPSEY